MQQMTPAAVERAMKLQDVMLRAMSLSEAEDLFATVKDRGTFRATNAGKHPIRRVRSPVQTGKRRV